MNRNAQRSGAFCEMCDLPDTHAGRQFMKPEQMARRAPLFLPIAFCTACATGQAELAERGRHGLTGLSQTDIRMCAGHPANAARVERGEIWVYEHGAAYSAVGAPTFVAPWGGFQLNQPNTGYCRVQIRFSGKRVAEVAYAGATDLWGARDAVCAPIIRSCVELAEQRRGP
jgi:hypothetical protein